MDEEYACERCKKIFYKKFNLQRHLERKNPCAKNNEARNNECNSIYIDINNTNIGNNNNIGNINNITNNYKFNIFLSNVRPKNFKSYPIEKLNYNNLRNSLYKNSDPISFIAKLIKEEYIDNVSKKERSIWCLDISRNKMLLRLKDKWIIDAKSVKFTNLTFDKIKKKLCDIFIQEIVNINEKILDENLDEATKVALTDESKKITKFLMDIKKPMVSIKTIKNIHAYIIYMGEEDLSDDEISLIERELKNN